MKHIIHLLTAALLISVVPAACAADAPGAQPEVKLSVNQICHVRGSEGYRQTKDARGFKSLAACQAAGGRLPENARATAAGQSPGDKSFFDTARRDYIKMSDQKICHDSRSPNFDNTQSFKAYRTMQDCLDSGGKRAGQ